jgi:apolipoprotein N-acyltransferase
MRKHFWMKIIGFALLFAAGITYGYIFTWIYLFQHYGQEDNPLALKIEMALAPIICIFALYLIYMEVKIRKQQEK